jgi:hypothetical protein
LVSRAFLTRPAALRITAITGPDWLAVIDWLVGDPADDLMALGLTRNDLARVETLRASLGQPDR